MTDIDHRLEFLRSETNEKGRTGPYSVREFVSWFDVQRRTPGNVEYIDEYLTEYKLKSIPRYTETGIDSFIFIEKASENQGGEKKAERVPLNAISDASFKIGMIASSRCDLATVPPDGRLEEAVTLMMARNFSQLPVRTGKNTIKGVISWATIGLKNTKGDDKILIKDYMEPARMIGVHESLFRGIGLVNLYDYVLVKDENNIVSGIVTATDIAKQFSDISKPFLLISEIENFLRLVIENSIELNVAIEACDKNHLTKKVERYSDFTFGNYLSIIENPSNWNKLNLKLDRTVFCAHLRDINGIRNDVMHFSQDPLSESDMDKLINVGRMMKTIHGLPQ